MRCTTAWARVTRNVWTLNTIKRGYRLEFVRRPNPPRYPPKEFRGTPEQNAVISEEVRSLLAKRAIQPVPEYLVRTARRSHTGRLFYSRIFAIPKKDGGQRPILDARGINRHVRKIHFKMEGLHTVRELLVKNDWFTKIDLSDAYLTLPVHRKSRRFLAFRWKGKTYVWKTLPFGLTSAPRVFSKVMRTVMKYLRARGIRIVQYLDDMLILNTTKRGAKRDGRFVASLLSQLGFHVNVKKSKLTPTQTMEFLGFTLDSRDATLSVPVKKVNDLRRDIDAFLKKAADNDGRTTLRKFASVLGKIAALEPAIMPTRLLSRRLLRTKNALLAEKRKNWDADCHIGPKTRRELAAWRSHLQVWNGRGLVHPAPQCEIYTDASGSGWGAHYGRRDARGHWSAHERTYHSNVKELLAVERALLVFERQLTGKSICIRTDNTVVIAYINHQGGRIPALNHVASRVWAWALTNKCPLQATHVPGSVNRRADFLSRVYDRSDWKLNPRWWGLLDTTWGPHTIDLFASHLNRQLPRYYSWMADVDSCGTDAFAQSWTGENAYANPPFNQIGKVLQKVIAEDTEITIVVPEWDQASWWPLLQQMALGKIQLPQVPDLFLPASTGNQSPIGRFQWKAAAYRVSAKRFKETS